MHRAEDVVLQVGYVALAGVAVYYIPAERAVFTGLVRHRDVIVENVFQLAGSPRLVHDGYAALLLEGEASRIVERGVDVVGQAGERLAETAGTHARFD